MKNNMDEREVKAFNNAQTAGIVVVVIICAFFFIVNAFGLDDISFDYIAIMFVYLAVVCFYSFAKFKNIYHFIIGLGFSFVFLCTLIMYFISLAG